MDFIINNANLIDKRTVNVSDYLGNKAQGLPDRLNMEDILNE